MVLILCFCAGRLRRTSCALLTGFHTCPLPISPAMVSDRRLMLISPLPSVLRPCLGGRDSRIVGRQCRQAFLHYRISSGERVLHHLASKDHPHRYVANRG